MLAGRRAFVQAAQPHAARRLERQPACLPMFGKVRNVESEDIRALSELHTMSQDGRRAGGGEGGAAGGGSAASGRRRAPAAARQRHGVRRPARAVPVAARCGGQAGAARAAAAPAGRAGVRARAPGGRAARAGSLRRWCAPAPRRLAPCACVPWRGRGGGPGEPGASSGVRGRGGMRRLGRAPPHACSCACLRQTCVQAAARPTAGAGAELGRRRVERAACSRRQCPFERVV